jgi:deazaflavin-dependent oxidoreductase (nitroreductase family)
VTDSGIGDQLAGWGKVAIIETTGRISGHPARAAVGYVDEPDGSLLVAAGDPDADWARNLEADPRCTVTIGERSWACAAELLEGPIRSAAIVELIVRYGTPAERLGNGPAFRLRRMS